ncbi:MAG: hypothetical protein ACXQTG_00190, partial [Methanoculleaceae archaeon]
MKQYESIAILTFSTIAAVAATILCLELGITIVFPHIYYIPIVYAAYRYPRRGIAFSIALGAVYWLLVALISA